MSLAGKHSSKAAERTDRNIDGELFFKRAFAHASIGLALVGLDGRFSYTNAAYSRITGYTPEELRHIHVKDLMHPDDAQSNAELRKQMLAGDIPGYVMEKRYIRKDGSMVWVKSSVSLTTDHDGKPLHIVGLTEDIDERHRAEEALRESEARFRFMAESMPQKVFTAKPDGELDYLSPQWTDYTGLRFSEMNLRDWTKVIHPGDRVHNQEVWQESVASGKPFFFEHRLRRADGIYRWHISRASAMRNERGEIIRWIGSATDIEELRKSRDLQARLHTLAEQRERLIHMNQLKDEFTMLASHQLRTPATGVKQYIGMLLEGYSDPLTEDQYKLLRSAYESNERQIRIVDDLLRVARVDAGQVSVTKSTCDIVQFIDSLVAQQQKVFYSRKQRVDFNSSIKAFDASIDTELMYIVLENLLDNASKYSRAGKTTTVGLLKDRKALVIAVTDCGVGISEKDQERLFQKFSRIANSLSAAANGTGLGLYWAKKIVELHGGTLEVVSKVRVGSTFRVRIPIS